MEGRQGNLANEFETLWLSIYIWRAQQFFGFSISISIFPSHYVYVTNRN